MQAVQPLMLGRAGSLRGKTDAPQFAFDGIRADLRLVKLDSQGAIQVVRSQRTNAVQPAQASLDQPQFLGAVECRDMKHLRVVSGLAQSRTRLLSNIDACNAPIIGRWCW